jgi:hypothetical protein
VLYNRIVWIDTVGDPASADMFPPESVRGIKT